MKSSIKFLSALVVALFCIGFTACENDDDNGASGGGGNCAVEITVNGKAYSIPYVHWLIEDGEMLISFGSWNIGDWKKVLNDPSYVKYPIHQMELSYPIKKDQTRIEADTITRYRMSMILDASPNKPGWEGNTSEEGWTPKNSTPLIIERDGDNITLTIEKAVMYSYVDDETDKNPRTVTVKCVGNIAPFPQDYLDFLEGMRDDY